MADCSKREVKAKSDLDNVLDSVKEEEKERKATLKSIENTEKLISSKSEVDLVIFNCLLELFDSGRSKLSRYQF